MHRFLLFVVLGIAVPTSVFAQAKSFGDPKISAALDAEILAVLKENKQKPVGPASDAEFHRRATLDLLGRIPTAEETQRYLADKNPDKQRQLIHRLLADWEMAAYWADVLHVGMNGRSADPGLGYKEFREYLRQSLEANKPWDKLARELLLPVTNSPTQPAAFFLGSRLRRENKEDQLDGMTVAVASTFFGVRMECAKCHDHPHVDEWKQDHYYGLASFLSRTELQLVNAKPSLRERDTGDVTFQNRKRDSFTAKVMFLDDKVFPEPKPASKKIANKKDLPDLAENSRRKLLADYALVADNRYFKRALVNRVWKQLMGVGLVEPVDQIHDGNTPTHPKLFDLLADDFAKNGFDLKRLVGNIMLTETYRRSSVWPEKERPKESHYAVFNLRPLTPEQLALSLATATGYVEILKAQKKKTEPKDLRAEMEKDYKLFIENYESENDQFAATTSQALFMTFNKTTQKYLQPVAGNLSARLVKTSDTEALARQAYLAILSRTPTSAESEAIAKYLQTSGAARDPLVRDVLWALLNSTEFRFNH